MMSLFDANCCCNFSRYLLLILITNFNLTNVLFFRVTKAVAEATITYTAFVNMFDACVLSHVPSEQ